MAQSNYATAVEWCCVRLLSLTLDSMLTSGLREFRLKDLLHFNPTCSPAARAYAMANLGECFLREHNFVEAEFYLQTSIAIEPNHKTTLKSLVSRPSAIQMRLSYADLLVC